MFFKVYFAFMLNFRIICIKYLYIVKGQGAQVTITRAPQKKEVYFRIYIHIYSIINK